jgi:hypothetical protein
MLEGRPFTVFTNYRPLVGALSRRSDPCSSRQQRHISFIAEFSPVIRHIAGQSNVVADTLSRPAGGIRRLTRGQAPPPRGRRRVGGIRPGRGKGALRVFGPPFCRQPGTGGGSGGILPLLLLSNGFGGLGGGSTLLPGLSPSSFVFCSQGDHHTDGQYIYYGGHIIRGFSPPCP